MDEVRRPLSATLSREEAARAFPRLSEDQLARMRARGRLRPLAAGEVLIEPGQRRVPFLVLIRGRIEVLRLAPEGEVLITEHRPGGFTGEVNMLAGRPSLVRVRSVEEGEAIELDREGLLALVQTDGELSEIVLRAFILRRLALVARHQGDLVVVGSSYCSGTLRVREFLNRNGHPYAYVDLDGDPGVQELLDQFQVGEEDIPFLIVQGDRVLRNPSNRETAHSLGFNPAIDPAEIHDLAVVGAGPAGLAAAVYAASEGLRVLVLEASAPGGQAGSSSRIENYLGFPTGISGQELAERAITQAQKFGARFLVAQGAARLSCDRRPYAIEVEGGERIQARTVIIATGANYRRPPLPGLGRFEGAGVYYAATHMERQLAAFDEVVVVGGGNSAGQAAVYLAGMARHVHLLVRGPGLADSMSRYLIRRIEGNPAITLRTGCEVTGLGGDWHVEQVTWHSAEGKEETRPIRHVFVMTGADPCSGWLEGCLAIDPKGFIRTGPEVTAEDLTAAGWPLPRLPYLLETSRPGVFAVGDVRAGNVKRVASAVGEGSIAVSFVHRVLHE